MLAVDEQSGGVVVVAARQAGSANALRPVIDALRARGIGVVLIAQSAAAQEAWGEAPATFGDIDSLDGLDVRAVASGTSLDVAEDQQLWRWAERRHIPCVALVDQWVSYWERFSTSKNTRFDAIPRTIAVVDELAAQRMLACGCPEERLVVTGSPAFDALEPERDDTLRARWLGDRDHLIVFVSEPHSERGVIPIDEHAALSLTITALSHLAERHERHFSLLVRPHPAESETKYAPHEVAGVQVAVDRGDDRHRIVSSCDLVVGMTSVLLYEALCLRRPVVSMQPPRRHPSNLVDGHDIPVATNPSEAEETLQHALDAPPPSPRARAASRATDAFLSLLLGPVG